MRGPAAVLDIPLAAAVLLGSLPGLVRALLRARPAKRPAMVGRRLLVFDCAYSLGVMRARQMEYVVLSRDLEGWFDHVWTIHPLVGASPDDQPGAEFGPVTLTKLSARHTMVEAKVSRFARLKAFPTTNFVLSQIALLKGIAGIVRTTPASAVMIADPYYLGLLGLLVARTIRAPLLLSPVGNHDVLYEVSGSLAYPRLLKRRAIEKRIGRFVFPRADMVLAGGENLADFALSNGAIPQRIARLHRGASIHPLHLAELRDRIAVSGDVGERPYAICVSRLEPSKHVEDALEAVAQVSETHPDLNLVLVGVGSLRENLADRARALGIDEKVRFVGTRDQQWLAGALRDATIVIAPIAGRALLEAALSETPIVAYNYDWQGEFIRQGETGLLVPYRDTSALAAAVAELLNDPERGRKIGAQARSEVCELKDPHLVAAELREKYSSLLTR